MNVQVIAPFIDRASGKRINPGDPLPSSMTEERLRKLEKARCIVIEGAPAATSTAPRKTKSKKRAAAQGAASTETLFPDGGKGEGSDADDNAGADPEALGGADGGDTGAGSEPDEGGRDAGNEQSQDDSDR